MATQKKDFIKYKEQKEKQGLAGWNSPVIFHPGEFLADALEEYNMTQADLSERLGLSRNFINDIIQEKNPITYATAMKLEKVFDKFSADYWIKSQQKFDLVKIRKLEDEKLSKEVQIFEKQEIKDSYKELAKLNIVTKLTLIKRNFEGAVLELQKFFAVDSLEYIDDTAKFVFRQYDRKNVNPYTLSAWLRIGKKKAQNIELNNFDKSKLKELLPELKKLSNKVPKEYLPIIEEELAKCGVVIVYMPNMKNTHVQGASKWVSKDKVLLMLNTSKRTEGKFWFNLYHELGHILLHSKKEVFIDYENNEKTSVEKEADDFAQKQLIPDFEKVKSFFSIQYMDIGLEKAILKTARKENISPDILAGRFTHEFKDNKKIYSALSPFLTTKIDYQNIIND